METWQKATYSHWRSLLPLDNEHHYNWNPNAPAFLEAVAASGDLTLTETWERAYVALTAKFLAELCAKDPQFLIEYHLMAAPRDYGWTHLVTAVVQQLLTMPKAVQALGDGWSVIREYGCLLRRTDPAAVEALLQPFAATLYPNRQRPHGASGETSGR